jgi:hypothetical protein
MPNITVIPAGQVLCPGSGERQRGHYRFGRRRCAWCGLGVRTVRGRTVPHWVQPRLSEGLVEPARP